MINLKNGSLLIMLSLLWGCSSTKPYSHTFNISPTKTMRVDTGYNFKLSQQICARHIGGLEELTIRNSFGYKEKSIRRFIDIMDFSYEKSMFSLSRILENFLEHKNIYKLPNTQAYEVNGLVSLFKKAKPTKNQYRYTDFKSIYYEMYDMNQPKNQGGFYQVGIYDAKTTFQIPSQFIHNDSHFIIKYSLIPRSDVQKKRYNEHVSNNSIKESDYLCSPLTDMKLTAPFVVRTNEGSPSFEHKTLYIVNDMIMYGKEK